MERGRIVEISAEISGHNPRFKEMIPRRAGKHALGGNPKAPAKLVLLIHNGGLRPSNPFEIYQSAFMRCPWAYSGLPLTKRSLARIMRLYQSKTFFRRRGGSLRAGRLVSLWETKSLRDRNIPMN
jgi:hypothetical protein